MFFLSSRLAQLANTSILKSSPALGPSSNLGDGILLLYLFVTVLRAIARIPCDFPGQWLKERAKTGPKNRPKNPGSKFSQIFQVTAQSPGQSFRGFVKNRAFGRPTERPLSHQFGETGSFSAPKLTNLYSKASMSTYKLQKDSGA